VGQLGRINLFPLGDAEVQYLPDRDVTGEISNSKLGSGAVPCQTGYRRWKGTYQTKIKGHMIISISNITKNT